MATCALVFASVSSGLGSSTKAAQRVLVAFLCLWEFMFGACLTTGMWITSVEMHPLRLRTYGQAFAIAINNVFQFACAFWTPYMINAEYRNMGTNIGYFYMGMEIAAAIILFLILPETGQLTLEKIDDYFASHTMPWATSLSKNKKYSE